MQPSNEALREQLWRTFAKYRRKHRAETDVADQEHEFIKRLKRTPAKLLSPQEMAQVTGYVGDVASFKHYLPRFLELAVDPEIRGGPDLILILIKLERYQLATWPEEERSAVETFLAAHGHSTRRIE